MTTRTGPASILRSSWSWRVARHYGLPLWFLLTTVAQWVYSPDPWLPGFDTKLVVGAARVWLQGGDPWSFALDGGGNAYHFAGLPPTLVIYAPLVPLGLDGSAIVGLLISAVSAVVILRRLRLPPWWWLFAPFNRAVVSANPDMPMLALLLLGASWLSPIFKVYALIPMLGELKWRQAAITAGIAAASFVALPALWILWARELSNTTARLVYEAQGGWSAWGEGPLLLVTLGALVLVAYLRDLRTAAWLAVPAVWPASEFNYSTMLMPVATPILSMVGTVPRHGSAPVAVIAYAAFLVWKTRGAPSRPRIAVRMRSAWADAGLGRLVRLLGPPPPEPQRDLSGVRVRARSDASDVAHR